MPVLHSVIQGYVESYLAELDRVDPTWPVDVRVVIADLQEHLFDLGLQVKHIFLRCGVFDHNISSRFALYVGVGPKAYVVKHRLNLAKKLLQDKRLQETRIIQIAFAVGYESHSGFSKIFKEHEGYPPGAFRKRKLSGGKVQEE
jgi:transcriptional regulator GlxA family with amidase domain